MTTLQHIIPTSISAALNPASDLFLWLKLILYCIFFVFIVMVISRKKNKTPAIITGSMIGIGLFIADRIYTFTFEHFVLAGIIFMIFLAGLVSYPIFNKLLKKK